MYKTWDSRSSNTHMWHIYKQWGSWQEVRSTSPPLPEDKTAEPVVMSVEPQVMSMDPEVTLDGPEVTLDEPEVTLEGPEVNLKQHNVSPREPEKEKQEWKPSRPLSTCSDFDVLDVGI